jgi:hypothetical protein
VMTRCGELALKDKPFYIQPSFKNNASRRYVAERQKRGGMAPGGRAGVLPLQPSSTHVQLPGGIIAPKREPPHATTTAVKREGAGGGAAVKQEGAVSGAAVAGGGAVSVHKVEDTDTDTKMEEAVKEEKVEGAAAADGGKEEERKRPSAEAAAAAAAAKVASLGGYAMGAKPEHPSAAVQQFNALVGLYALNSVDPYPENIWFHPSS